MERLLQAHGGEYREEQKRRDNFRAGRAPDSRMGCEDPVPMERRPTLPVNEILAAESGPGITRQCREDGATPACLTEVEGSVTSIWLG